MYSDSEQCTSLRALLYMRKRGVSTFNNLARDRPLSDGDAQFEVLHRGKGVREQERERDKMVCSVYAY